MQKRSNPLELKIQNTEPQQTDVRDEEALVRRNQDVRLDSVPSAALYRSIRDTKSVEVEQPAAPAVQEQESHPARSAEAPTPKATPVKIKPEQPATPTAQVRQDASRHFEPMIVQDERIVDQVFYADEEIEEPRMPYDTRSIISEVAEQQMSDYEDEDAVFAEPEVQEQETVEKCSLEEEFDARDFAMASRFTFSGDVSRRLVLGKISSDLCYLAKVLHPNQSLSKILENALLTRIFLENRDAFDALDIRIEERGGHIKC